MPVPFVFGPVDTASLGTDEAADEQADRRMTDEEQHGGRGEEPLPPEDDGFFVSEEFERMESEWRRVYCFNERLLDSTLTLRSLVRHMRDLTDELEGLLSQGYVLDLDAMGAWDGDIATLVSPAVEREQWRLRRERRRAAIAQEQRAGAGEAGGLGAAGDAMETEESGGSGAAAQGQRTAAPPAPPKSPQAPPPAFELC